MTSFEEATLLTIAKKECSAIKLEPTGDCTGEPSGALTLFPLSPGKDISYHPEYVMHLGLFSAAVACGFQAP